MVQIRISKNIYFFTLLVLLACTLVARIYFSANSAVVNFDFFMYVGVIHQYFGDGSVTALEFVKETVQTEMPWHDTSGYMLSSGYGREVWTNPIAFEKQLPYYTIKPTYPILMHGFHILGLEYLQASVLISSASYACMIILVWLSISDGLTSYSVPAILLALIISLYHPIYTFTRYSTPDMLNAFIILLSAYVAFRHERWWLAFGIAVLAIYVRPDSILWVGGMWIGYVAQYGVNLRNIMTAAIAPIAGLAAYFSLRLIDEPYSILLLQKIFFSPLVEASAHPDLITEIYDLPEIIARYRDATVGLFNGSGNHQFSGNYLFMVTLGGAGLASAIRLKLRAEVVWFIAPLSAMLVFHLVMPKEHDRNLIYAYMVIFVGWARLWCSRPNLTSPFFEPSS